MKRTLFALGLGLAAGLMIASMAEATPEPAYQVREKADAVEIRVYPAMAAAEATVPGARGAAANAAFQPLFKYISGANEGRAKIEMTAPVTLSRPGEKIEMTAPVTQTASQGGWAVRFILPPRFTAANAPRPTDAAVHIVEIAPQTVAVIRFSGVANDAAIEKRTKELERFVRDRGLTPSGPMSYAFYDPPWTPWFLRRNEIMVPVG